MGVNKCRGEGAGAADVDSIFSRVLTKAALWGSSVKGCGRDPDGSL